MAAPFVAGVATLIIAKRRRSGEPALGAAGLHRLITRSGRDLCGWGLVNPFIDAGGTPVPLDRILDVDLDRNLLVVTREGVKTPMLCTTPDAARAGAVLARAAGL